MEIFVLFVNVLFLIGNNFITVETKESVTTCYGTHVGFGFSGGPEFHYESLIRRYIGCTHVEGNLEITNLESSANISYDLSFLSTIRVVTGYVLIGLLDVETIPLTSLRLIRADNTYSILGEEYGLVVALTSEPTRLNDGKQKGLRELQMPFLREISRGRVLFQNNPQLRFVSTIAWDVIVPGKMFPVIKGENAYYDGRTFFPWAVDASDNLNADDLSNANEDECDPSCEVDGKKHCWGKGKDMCQKVEHLHCDPSCPGRCYDSDILGCCHPECAVGCNGPSETECTMCKYFKYGKRCVSSCPVFVSYRSGQDCIVKEPKFLKTLKQELFSAPKI